MPPGTVLPQFNDLLSAGNGNTDDPIYYQERMMPWDYRWFDLDCMNSLLKGEIELIEEGYAPFWQQ